MEILNIGVLELIVILMLMFIVLGPKDMIVTAQRVGRWIRTFVRSPMWREIMGYSQEIRELPKKIMDESGLEETLKEVKASTQAAVTEVNTSLKEAADAARVPEVEHLRLETGSAAEEKHTILPPSAAEKQTPSAEPPAPAVEDAAPTDAVSEAEVVEVGVQGGVDTVIDAGEQPESAATVNVDLARVDETATTSATEPGANGTVSATEPAVVVVAEPSAPRKPRRKRAVEETSTTVAEAATETAAAGPGEGITEAPVRKTRARKPKSEAADLKISGAESFPSDTPITPTVPTEPELSGRTAQELVSPEAPLPSIDESQTSTEPLPATMEPPQRRSGTRKPKVGETDATSEAGPLSPEAPESAAVVPERRTRTRKPKVEEPQTIPDAELVSKETPEISTEVPERRVRTRKPRVEAAPAVDDTVDASETPSPNDMSPITTTRPRRGARKYPVQREAVPQQEDLNPEVSSTVETGDLTGSGNGTKPHVEQPAENKDMRGNAG